MASPPGDAIFIFAYSDRTGAKGALLSVNFGLI